MAQAGYACSVGLSGTAVTLTEEACTRVTANTVYQITDADKRILNPAAAVVVEVDPDGDNNWEAGENYAVDYLFGTVTFDNNQGDDALVRVSGEYLPIWEVAEGRDFELNITRNLPDASVFGSQNRTRIAALADVNGTIGSLDTQLTDIDTGGDELKPFNKLTGGTPILLEVDLVATKFRAWVLLKDYKGATTVDELFSSTLGWELAVRDVSDGTATFGFGT